MARLSQKELDQLAKSRKDSLEHTETLLKENSVLDEKSNSSDVRLEINPKMINDILNDGGEPPYKYKLPKGYSVSKKSSDIPLVKVDDYPKLSIKGKFSVDRQIKGANLYLLKEIDYLLEKINEGKNKNATLNFLIWVGLQTLKGMNETIDIHIHDSTYADGQVVTTYLEEK